MLSTIALDDYLTIEGFYVTMEEHRESQEEGCEGIAEQIALDKFNARLPL
jgi:hypothetical protein